MSKKMISLEISDELREALRIEAFKRAMSISALIRQLLESSLNINKTTISEEVTNESNEGPKTTDNM
jgi:predicted nucleic acid-binding protein